MGRGGCPQFPNNAPTGSLPKPHNARTLVVATHVHNQHVAKIPLHPKHPERICWGCDKFCPADDLRCGNGTERAPHPVELFGDDWYESERERWKQEEKSSPKNDSA